ncbi:MAG TPA: M23 family metallopeptidase [Rubrobacter sp.]|nr:M23 family metallopeptidase [Rubrobacter sp.]
METTTTDYREIGVSLEHPAGWVVEQEQYMISDTYGFQCWKPTTLSPRACSGIPAVRVAVAPGLTPDQIEQTVQEKLDAYREYNLPMADAKVSVGVDELEGHAVGPMPGSTPSYEVYVSVRDLVYLINIYEEELDASARRLLASVNFEKFSQSRDSLELPDIGTQTGSSRPRLAELEQTALRAGRAARAEALAVQPQDAPALGPVTQPQGPPLLAPAAASEPPVLDPAEVPEEEEVQINEGCFRADSRFFVQTQHGKFANSQLGPEETGWTVVGRPNFWGHFSHGALGFGRCVSGRFTNDLFAIDYPLAVGDAVFCPFKRGTVKFVGRSESHRNYGIMVIIEAVAPSGNRYVSMSAHLSGLADGIVRGAQVTDETVIGFADATGHPSIPVGEPHLHQAFYRNPNFVFIPGQGPTGPPFGGQGLQVIYHHFVGDARGSGPGVYKLDRTTHFPDTGTVPSSGRFRISN